MSGRFFHQYDLDACRPSVPAHEHFFWHARLRPSQSHYNHHRLHYNQQHDDNYDSDDDDIVAPTPVHPFRQMTAATDAVFARCGDRQGGSDAYGPPSNMTTGDRYVATGTSTTADDDRCCDAPTGSDGWLSPPVMQTSARSERTDDSGEQHGKRCACDKPRPANYCAPVHRSATARCANCGLLMTPTGAENGATGARTSAGLKLARYIAERLRRGVRRHSLRNRFDARLLAQYDVLDVIGRGSFSTVYRAVSRADGRRYAVKATSVKADCVAAVDNELCILSRLSHPYVVRLREVFRSRRSLFAVLELARGGELYERIVRKGRFTEPETIWCVRMLLCGVCYLHGMGVTHRDLKPENLLFSDTGDAGRLLITDFGLAHQARTADGSELMTDTCGTPEYIAPEVLMRFPYNNKVDVWAVGVITYILLSGLMPFDDTNRSKLYRQIIRGQYYFYPDYWNTVSEEARGFVASLLDADSSGRPSADAALRHGWLARDRRPRPVTTGQLQLQQNGHAPPAAVHAPHIARRHLEPAPAHSITTLGSAGGDNAPTATATATSVEHTPHRTRSVRSVARSDHRCRVDACEVARLVDADPELRAIVYDRRARRWRRHKTGAQSAVDEPQRRRKGEESGNGVMVVMEPSTPTVTKHYGLV